MNATQVEVMAEAFETFMQTDVDKKGRVFGYVIGLREVVGTGACYAWVQRSVRTRDGFADFGPRQRSKKFPSLAAAKAWAYRAAKERAAK